MRRILFNAFAGLSLLLLVALAPFWLGCRVIVNLHRCSLQFDAYHRAVYWACDSSGDYHNGTISFFAHREDDAVNGGGLLRDAPEFQRVREHHPSGLWLGTEPTGRDNDRVGWFSLVLATGVSAAGPVLWTVLRLRRGREVKRRGKRVGVLGRLRQLASLLSLAALSVSAFFWIVSSCGFHISVDWLWSMSTEPAQGAVMLRFMRFPIASPPELSGNWYWVPPAYRSVNRPTTGFHFAIIVSEPELFGIFTPPVVATEPSRSIGFFLQMPDWFLCAIAALLPAGEAWAWARRRKAERHRGTPGLCARCGYDLRATTDRCPECGKVFAAS